MNLYKVIIYDHGGSPYLHLTTWDRLEVTQRVSSPWNYSLQIRVRWDDPLGELLRTLKRDYFIKIFRIDRYDNDEYLVFEGLHSTVAEQVQTTGDIFFNLYGVGYTKLLDRRVVVPPAGFETYDLANWGETVAKTYVTHSMINPDPAYGDPAEDRIFPGFQCAADLGRGNWQEYSSRNIKLDSIVDVVCGGANLYYGVTGGQDLGVFIFDARPVWGEDRRVGYSANPLIFSVDMGNMFIPILTSNQRHETNVVLVGGAGRGVDQMVLSVKNADSIAESPWARSEVWVSDTDLVDNQSLTLLGKQELRDRGKRQEFTFDVREIQGSRWLADWNIGDYVTAYYKGRTFEKIFTQITTTVTGSGTAQFAEAISVEMEDVWIG